ncbi:hypothetical protein HMPREF0080_00955 [Anaeroglobus geminatus F0357]|uniref:Uncharacterized protein n=1 Tax=Anaeroglobus geminatus F0357 TaxID=861450 RepID=G9YH30_9FIRM|nr:hypothetical protein HMPREF0080_00955 [Anaeroglobus geminatus F0357]
MYNGGCRQNEVNFLFCCSPVFFINTMTVMLFLYGFLRRLCKSGMLHT